jgi:hypothetical protein
MFAVLHERNRAGALGVAAVLATAVLFLGGNAAAEQPAAAPAADTTGGLVAQALAYEHGEGTAKDQRKAALLYCEGARAGDAEATFRLGWMYANGRGVVHSDAMAAFLFARAAAAGHVYAREMQRYVGDDSGVVPDCMRPPEPDPPVALMDESPDPFADLPPDKKKIADLVVRAAPQFAIEPRLALAVIATESNFRPDARSVKDARGVMQLLYSTAARFKVRNRSDVRDNVQGGLAYLRWLLAYYEGQVTLAVAAYNAGEAAVDKYNGVPPYPETRDYVRRVRLLYPNERHSFDPGIVGPSPILTRSDKEAFKGAP